MKSADRPQSVTWGQVAALMGVVVGIAAAWCGWLLDGRWAGTAMLSVPLVSVIVLVRSEMRAQRWYAFELSLAGADGRSEAQRRLSAE
ncbi:MAG: hypothetical protein JWO27_3229 [Frankiales bacterium]|jgi:hypothetical protein|nr:hypothetical protein [Frankiales bacterium]MCW2706809.1 hypothetical protein [Frankiales bacterium]